MNRTLQACLSTVRGEMLRLILSLSLAALLFVVTSAFSQTTTGTLTGTIFDNSGAVVAAAALTLTDNDTGATRTADSNGSGVFNLAGLPPGPYTLSVSARGFATQKAQVTIALGQVETLDLHLMIGQSNQTVQVNAAESSLQLQRDSHEISTVLEQHTIENLPANGRDLFQTLASAPNVNLFVGGSGDNIGYFGLQQDSLTIGGAVYGTTSYLQDGVSNFNLVAKTANLQPSIESVQEVSLVANGAPARYDEPSVVNVITKGGTSAFHGRAYDYLRNDALDAIGYFNAPKPPLRYNQFGVNLGGPILKKKLFFFFDYSGLRYSQGQTITAVVPTAAERTGDFSADKTTIYDPSTYNPATGAISPFPGNKIDNVSNFASLLLAYYPLPTASSVANTNFQKTASKITSYDSYLGRLDYTLGANDSMYGAYETTNPVASTPSFSTSSIFNSNVVQEASNSYVQETHTFGSYLVNIARFGYNYSNISVAPQGAGLKDYLTDYGIKNLNPDPSQYMPPVVAFSSHTGEGFPNNPNGAIQRLYAFEDEADYTLGHHTLVIGGELDRIDLRRFSADYNNGYYTFTGQFTSNHKAAALSGGNDIADFLLGYATQSQGGVGNTTANFTQWNVMPYLQDDWKITRNLVLNLGMRYDFYSSPTAPNSSVYDVPTNTTHPGSYHTNYWNLAPRLGFAYTINTATSIHGGYGIYYTPFEYQELTFLLVHPPNFLLQSSSYPLSSPVPVTDAFSANPATSSAAPFTLALNMPTPYVQQTNLAIQRTLGTSWIASVSYLGNKFTHQQIRYNPNQASLPTGPTDTSSIQSRRPYSYVGDVYEAASIGYANYNALQTELQRRFANGLSLQTSYVWSKALDVQSSGINPPEYGRDIARDYGPSDFNPKHTFKFSGVYQLPFGPSRTLLRSNNFFNRELVGGWQISDIFTVFSGLPFSTGASDLSNTGIYHAQRANQVCNGNAGAPQTVTKWFNTACFTAPGVGQLGDQRKNNLVGPRNTNLDLSLFKDFSLWRENSLQFRADFFDSLNHSIFATPSATITAATFGQLTAINAARVIQLSLKLSF